MTNLVDLPDELIIEILNYLGPFYNEARLAHTCKQTNNRIWKFRKHLNVPEEIFEQYFATTEFNLQRYIGLESLTIPKISPQITQLSHLTYLRFNYDGSAEQASIINQLTQLQSLVIYASRMVIDNLQEMIGDKHKLTDLTLYTSGCPKNLFQLPIINQFKSVSLYLESEMIEEATIGGLFNMINLTKLVLESVRVNVNQISGFSRLIHLQEAFVHNIVSNNMPYINFEEFGALKKLTALDVDSQQLVEEDFRKLGKLVSVEDMHIHEIHNPFHMEYFSGLTNLTRLRVKRRCFTSYSARLARSTRIAEYAPSNSAQLLSFKYLTKLEHLVLCADDSISQLQYLPRLTHLAVRDGRLTTEQCNHIGLITQLRSLNISCEVEAQDFNWSALDNVAAVTFLIGDADDDFMGQQQNLIGKLKQLKNMRELNPGHDLDGTFKSLKQLTQLTKLRLNMKESQFDHESWDLAALPFKVEFDP